MGLAASQGRLLALTARNHDLIYRAQQVEQQRLFLAEYSREAGDKYNKAMNNKIMLANVNGVDMPLTYDLITNQNALTGLCMRLVDMNGSVVIPGECLEVQKTQTDETTGETSTVSTERCTSVSDFVNTYMKDLSSDEKTELSTYSMAQIFNYYNNNYENKDENISVTYKNKNNSDIVKDGDKVLIDANVYDNSYIQEMIISGVFKFQQARPDGSFEDLMWQGSQVISQVYDTSDDAAAEAEYEAAMADAQRKDKILELELNQIKTEQSAVQTELDATKKTIEGNMDGFKTFG